jgi:hypothetical protein
MIYSKIIIIGSGPSGTTAAYSLIEEKKKVLMLDQGYTNNTQIRETINNNKIFHPKLLNKKYQHVVYNFLKKNKIIQKNFFLTGSLALGGLSNIWGGGYWNYYQGIFHKSFNNFLNNNFKILNFHNGDSFKINKFFRDRNSNTIYKSAQLLSLKNKKQIFNSIDIIKKLRKKKIFSYKKNSFVRDIFFKKNLFIVSDDNGNHYKCKILILACGTIGSTRLVMKFNKIINVKQKLLHNVSYGFLGITKKKFVYKKIYKHSPNLIFMHNNSKLKSKISGSIGHYSGELGEFINKKFIFPLNILINLLFNFFKFYLIFGKIFLPAKFCNTKIYLDKNENLIIDGATINLDKKNKVINNFFKANKNKFIKIYQKELPLGSDSHYTSTMSPGSKIKKLKTNSFGELISKRNLFIVDASIIGKEGSHFPTLEIMKNAYKIGKYIAQRYN